MDNLKLLNYQQLDNFHHFSMEGVKGVYHLTVINPPNNFGGPGWSGEDHYIAIYENRNTKSSSFHSYNFFKSYFKGDNKSYLPHRLGVSKSCHEDFMNCVQKFVYPRI
jgi:hypothetical protein